MNRKAPTQYLELAVDPGDVVNLDDIVEEIEEYGGTVIEPERDETTQRDYGFLVESMLDTFRIGGASVATIAAAYQRFAANNAPKERA